MKLNMLKMDKLDQQLYYSMKGDFEKSDALLDELSIERPFDYRVKYNMAFKYLRDGDVHKGMELLNMGRLINIFGNGNLPYPLVEDVNNLKGKTVVLNLEGGFGDNFVGLKFALELNKKGAKVIILSPKALHCFLKFQPYVHSYYSDYEKIKETVDFWMPSMASEYLFKYKEYSEFPTYPHLFFPNDHKPHDKIKIGVKFQGGKLFEHDCYRSPPVNDIVDSLSIFKDNENVEIYSLEKDPIDLPDWIIKSNIDDWCYSAGLIQQMTFVVSTCTAVAHLSAGLGKKTFIIVPVLPYWIWAHEKENDGSWYYQDVTLIRQTEFGNWSNTLSRLQFLVGNTIK
jgi:hypothetical protein